MSGYSFICYDETKENRSCEMDLNSMDLIFRIYITETIGCLKGNKIGSRKYDNEYDDKSPPFDPITMLSL